MGRNKDRIEQMSDQLKQLRSEVKALQKALSTSSSPDIRTVGKAPRTQPDSAETRARALHVILAVADEQYGEAMDAFVAGRSWKKKTVFEVVHVVEPEALTDLAAFAGLSEQVVAEQRRAGEKLVATVAEKIEKAAPGAKIQRKVLSGVPAAEIIDIADKANADLIVVGSHGRTGVKRLILGSVSLSVVSQARCDVSVVRLQKSWSASPQQSAAGATDFSPLRADSPSEQSRH